jgi:hypothetical protein
VLGITKKTVSPEAYTVTKTPISKKSNQGWEEGSPQITQIAQMFRVRSQASSPSGIGRLCQGSEAGEAKFGVAKTQTRFTRGHSSLIHLRPDILGFRCGRPKAVIRLLAKLQWLKIPVTLGDARGVGIVQNICAICGDLFLSPRA